MDIHIVYEHVEREIYNAHLLKFELEKRGYDVKISPILEPKLPYLNAPKLLITPWFYDNDNVEAIRFAYIRRMKKVLSLQYEQVISKNWIEIGTHCPSDLAQRANTVCWGEKIKRRYMYAGVPEKNLKVIGDIKTDFSKPEFQSIFKTKKELSEEFNIPLSHDWHLFISSFSFANPNQDFINTLKHDMKDDNKVKIWHDINLKSKNAILNWIEKFITENPNEEFIYRPHPSEFKTNDPTEFHELEKKYPNFHFIFKYPIQDWIVSSQYINTWISTSIIDVYLLNKKCNILRPLKLDPYYDIETFVDATHLTSYEEFERENSINSKNPFPISKETLREYYNIDRNNYIFKEIADYAEEIINDKKYEKNFYNYFPLLDNILFIVKKILNKRIFYMFKNFTSNKETRKSTDESIDYDKINLLKKIVEKL